MRVLALDTTTRDGSVGIVDDGRVLALRSGPSSRSHAERLPGDLMDVLADAGMTPRDIDLFSVASGPGSFTGVRIGLAAIQGMAMVTGKKVVAVSALDALAMAAAERLTAPARVAAWMDALRQEVFSAVYDICPPMDWTNVDVAALDAPQVDRPLAIVEQWQRNGCAPALVIGDGAVRYAALLADVASVEPPPPLAPFLARLAAARVEYATPPSGIEPLYVRRTDVELARDRAAAQTSRRDDSPAS
ncbi:MAG: tRNA (adenosine(37)-N6)-threonylcarbamoyltransferase complex dimerization subunit type 1 TsaB [Acidobacteriaceae bacterium]|jgi:tRNA threonylcarbamoyladenosine biosynthesis protein TsaB|nr:tRNA (adenosine(37)-N6)-threonylcarbamoyltransferase complex dimerization subunit type 1 TsaB [Acidobacteriaceae bacterium]